MKKIEGEISIESPFATEQDEMLFDKFDFYKQADKDYSNLFGKTYRERRQRKKELKEQGLSGKEARQQARSEIGKTGVEKFFGKVSEAAKKVGRVAVKGVLVVPRNAFLGLLRLNYRGFATRINSSAQATSKVRTQWEKWGGSVESLNKAITAGKGKNPIICGVKCKQNIQSNFDGADILEGFQYSNLDPATNTAAAVVSATPLSVKIAGILAPLVPELAEVVQKDKEDKRQFELLSKQQQAELEQSWAMLNQQLDPKTQILNSTTLSPEEKQAAIQIYNEEVAAGMDAQLKQALIYGGIGLGVVVLLLIINKATK